MKRPSGFTIVELLIVIVVIGILAAIVIVAFNGVQSRARTSSMQADLQSINKAIMLYHADKGYYPNTGTTGGNVTGTNLAVPGIVPTYIARIPTFPAGVSGYYAYIWSANGVDYKLVRLINTGDTLPASEAALPNKDTTRTDRGWGYWSSGGSAL